MLFQNADVGIIASSVNFCIELRTDTGNSGESWRCRRSIHLTNSINEKESILNFGIYFELPYTVRVSKFNFSRRIT